MEFRIASPQTNETTGGNNPPTASSGNRIADGPDKNVIFGAICLQNHRQSNIPVPLFSAVIVLYFCFPCPEQRPAIERPYPNEIYQNETELNPAATRKKNERKKNKTRGNRTEKTSTKNSFRYFSVLAHVDVKSPLTSFRLQTPPSLCDENLSKSRCSHKWAVSHVTPSSSSSTARYVIPTYDSSMWHQSRKILDIH